MRVHLYTTDESGLRLVERLAPGDELVAVVVPENRIASAKVKRLTEKLGRELTVHRRGAPVAGGLPPADAAISWLYSQILPPCDLAAYPRGILNMHGGKIPEYRGASVLQWAIINGEKELGITWHELIEEVDAGPIWAEATIPIAPNATGADLREAMIAAGIDLFPQAWSRFCTRIDAPRCPSLDGGHVWPQRRPADGEIAPALPEIRLRNLVRALGDPWPPAWLAIDGRRSGVAQVLVESAPDTVSYLTAEGRVVYLQLMVDR